jgi:crotonobetainyl-CoA:carnitine CoA-transferase CaiB-like acyl-CoA transferase
MSGAPDPAAGQAARDEAAARPRRPLDGLVVVDLGQIYNGPYAGLLFALAGATVVKVEPPSGDLLRVRGGRVQGALYPFCALNANKRGITLDLKNPRGRELLLRLAKRADVLIENFRPGVMDRLGLGSEKLLAANPRLVYGSGSGFGSAGPYRDYPAMDITVQAISGVMSITGFPDREPVKAGPAVADFAGGVHLYAAIATALVERSLTGRGVVVEAAMHDAVIPSLSSSLGLFIGTKGSVPLRTGNRHNGLAEAPYNVYATSDGHLALICVSDRHWDALLETIGRTDLREDARFAGMAERVAHIDDVDALVAGFTATRTTQQAFDELREGGVPCAPVKGVTDVMDDPHLHARGMLQEVDHPEMGPITGFGSPLRFDGAPATELLPSPGLGEHNDEVARELLGCDDAEIAALHEAGAFGA